MFTMVVKTLTITEKAYESLKKLKFSDESFSEVILRISKEKRGAISKFFGILKMSEKEAEEWQQKVRQRKKNIDLEFKKRQDKFKEILAAKW